MVIVRTDEQILEHLKESDRPVDSIPHIADEIGVTRNTVRNHIDKVLEHEEVKTDVIGQANVYWWEEVPPDEPEEPPGFQLTRETHPWVGPLEFVAHRTALYAGIIFLIAYVALTFHSWGAAAPSTTPTTALAIFELLIPPALTLLGLSFLCLVTLDLLMDPTEGPIRKHFPSRWPDSADREVH